MLTVVQEKLCALLEFKVHFSGPVEPRAVSATRSDNTSELLAICQEGRESNCATLGEAAQEHFLCAAELLYLSINQLRHDPNRFANFILAIVVEHGLNRHGLWAVQSDDVVPRSHRHPHVACNRPHRSCWENHLARLWHETDSLVKENVGEAFCTVTQTVQPDYRVFVLDILFWVQDDVVVVGASLDHVLALLFHCAATARG